MGRDKALLPIDGVPMAARVADALRAAGASEVVAVGGDVGALRDVGLDARPDDHPGDGPLPGTITALRATVGEIAVVAPCDLVRPDPRAFTELVAALRSAPEAAGAVAVVAGRHQWATMAWRVGVALEGLQAAYEAGARSLRRAAPTLALVEVPGLAAAAFADADTPADLP